MPQAAVEAEIEAAEQAYMSLDDIGFTDRVNLIAGLQLPCVREPMSPEAISRVHRLMGIHLYALGNDSAAFEAMEASRYSFDHSISDELLPPHHDLRVRYEAATEAPAFKSVPEPRSGSLSINGVYGQGRPDGIPVVVQIFDSTGITQETLYLGAREPLPSYRAIPRSRNRLLVCAGGAALLSGVSLGAGWATNGSLYSAAADQDTTAEKLDSIRVTTDALAFTSGLMAGLAVGCGVGAVAVGER